MTPTTTPPPLPVAIAPELLDAHPQFAALLDMLITSDALDSDGRTRATRARLTGARARLAAARSFFLERSVLLNELEALLVAAQAGDGATGADPSAVRSVARALAAYRAALTLDSSYNSSNPYPDPDNSGSLWGGDRDERKGVRTATAAAAAAAATTATAAAAEPRPAQAQAPPLQKVMSRGACEVGGRKSAGGVDNNHFSSSSSSPSSPSSYPYSRLLFGLQPEALSRPPAPAQRNLHQRLVPPLEMRLVHRCEQVLAFLEPSKVNSKKTTGFGSSSSSSAAFLTSLSMPPSPPPPLPTTSTTTTAAAATAADAATDAAPAVTSLSSYSLLSSTSDITSTAPITSSSSTSSTSTTTTSLSSFASALTLPARLLAERDEGTRELRAARAAAATATASAYRQLMRAQVRQLSVLERLVRNHKLGTQRDADAATARWLNAVGSAARQRLRALLAHALAETYTRSDVRALTAAREALLRAEASARATVRADEARLEQLRALGPEFQALAARYTRALKTRDNLQRALE